jgi:hypothetical protein
MKRYAENKPTNQKYYTCLNRKGFVEITGKPVELTFFGVKIDAVLHNAQKDKTDIEKWNIIEQQTGMKLTGGRTQKDALENVNALIEETERRAKEQGVTPDMFYDNYFNKKPLSPRYQ